jgi:hypothetical protein
MGLTTKRRFKPWDRGRMPDSSQIRRRGTPLIRVGTGQIPSILDQIHDRFQGQSGGPNGIVAYLLQPFQLAR